MSRRVATFRPSVEGLEAKVVLSHAHAAVLHPAIAHAAVASIHPAVAAAPHFTGTIPITGSASYDASTGLNLITAKGRGGVGPVGGAYVQIVIAQATAADGSVVNVGGMFITSRYGTTFASLSNPTPSTITANSLSLPTTATYSVLSGPGALNKVVGTATVFSNTHGLYLKFS